MSLAQQYDVVEAVVSDRTHESLRVRVEVRTSRGQPQRFYVVVAEQPAERDRVERVAVEYEVPLAQQKAIDRVEQTAPNRIIQRSSDVTMPDGTRARRGRSEFVARKPSADGK
jgi:hypothetical protein